MVKITHENPFDELEKLMHTRKMLSARTDQLAMLVERGSLKDELPVSVEVDNRGLVFRSTHRRIIAKALACMLCEYRKRLSATESKIKALSEKLITYTNDNP